MKKLLSGLVAASFLLGGASAAHAQYHQYTSGKPSIEVDLSALDSAVPPTRSYDPKTHSTVPRAPLVTRVPLTNSQDPFGDAFDPPITQQQPIRLSPPPQQLQIQQPRFQPQVSAQPQYPQPQFQQQPAPAVRKRLLKPALGANPPLPANNPSYAATVPSNIPPANVQMIEPPRPQIIKPVPMPVAMQQPQKPLVMHPPKPEAIPAFNPSFDSAAIAHQKMPEPEFTPRITEEPRTAKVKIKPPVMEAPEEVMPEEIIPEDKLAEEELTAPVPAEKTKVALLSVPGLKDLTLEFAGTASEIDPALSAKLDQVIGQMQTSESGRLQVRGYASGEDGTTSSARRIALSRALAVRSYLMDRGIKPTRVDVRALGSETDRSPVDRVDLIFVH